MNKIKTLIILLTILLFSCSDDNNQFDAYGNFEVDEILISSETGGKIIYLDLEEGDKLPAGKTVIVIDTSALSIKMDELKAKRNAVSSKSGQVIKNIDVLKEKRINAVKNKKRIEKLVSSKAAPQKELDDINDNINVIDKEIEAVRSQNSPIVNEVESIDAEIEGIKLQIKKSKIINPVEGTVLNKYCELYEMTAPGKPLYSLARLDEIYIKVYVSGDMLSDIRIGGKAEVYFDKNSKENYKTEGIVTWVASKAEFTPKIIQTKEERVNLVYAVKIKVKNDGKIKIGMPGSVNFK